MTRNNRCRHKNRRRAEIRAQKRKEKKRLIDAEKQELLNKDDVVLSGEDKKLQSDKLTSFEVYVRRYNKVGRVNNKTDDDASSLITQDPSPRFAPLLDKSPSNVYPILSL